MNLILYGLLVSLLPSVDRKPDTFLIDWSADRHLTWADFKAAPDSKSSNAALTSTTITMKFGYEGSTLQYHIRCQFDKKSSWVHIKYDYILSHEQGHFDLAELYARKLNKEFKNYTDHSSDISSHLSKIYNRIMGEMHTRQLQYDKETNFSINRPKQEEWIKKIAQELKEYEGFAAYQ